MTSALPASLLANPRLSSWLRFDAHERLVHVASGKVELGQGIGTALMQIVADELGVDLACLRLVAGHTGLTPDEGWTAASLSVAVGGGALRLVCAEVRALFKAAAAQLFQCSGEDIRFGEGVFSTSRPGQSADYWSLARHVDLDRDFSGGLALPPAPAQRRYVGQSTPRHDLRAKLTQGGFIHDETLDAMLHGRVLHPPRPGCRLVALDTTPVEPMPGVIATVVDGSFAGVVAEREEQAVNALEKLRRSAVWSEEGLLPPGDDLEGFLRQLPVKRRPVSEAKGRDADIGEGLRLDACYLRPAIAHASIGPACALAFFDAHGATIISHTQGVFPLRAALAKVLALPVERVTVMHRAGAGCYGHNGADDVALDAALLSRAVKGRPVRVLWSREDELSRAPCGPPMLVDLSATVVKGRIADWRHRVISMTHMTRPGWRNSLNLLAAGALAQPLDDPEPEDPPLVPFGGGGDRNAQPLYVFDRHCIDYDFSPVQPFRTSALRSLGAYHNIFAIESFLDECAAAAGIDPLELRLSHLQDARAVEVIREVARQAHWQPGAQGTGEWGRGFGFGRYKNNSAYLAVVAEVEISQSIRVTRIEAVADAGCIVNPDGALNQIEGGIIQSISWTLKEELRWTAEGISAASWDDYPILRFDEIPHMRVTLMDRPAEPPLGVGECAGGPVAAAIANAVHHALGLRLRRLPLTPERVREAIG